MSVPPRRLPGRPSLEQLRKEAKEHLDMLCAADPSVNLAAAQHALAREYGFESRPKLVHHVESTQPANRMLQPAELKSDQKLMWSPGRGTDVWALIQACASGDLEAVRALIAKGSSLARSHYDYRKPLYFAVRENRIEVVRFLLDHDRNPLDLWVDDDPIEIARDLRVRSLADRSGDGPRGGGHGTPDALAESFRRARDRLAAPRMPRPCDRLERALTAAPSRTRPRLLPRLAAHLALPKDSPIPRVVQPPTSGGVIVQLPHLGGLHHHYERRAA